MGRGRARQDGHGPVRKVAERTTADTKRVLALSCGLKTRNAASQRENRLMPERADSGE